jgi:DeoR/GlpR family transcriptional regulator of sugar metabolism
MAEELNQSRSLKVDRARPFPHRRHAHILQMLAKTGTVEVRNTAADLGVSEMTVRRDLIDLENAGKLVRIHGGAIDVDGNQPATIDRDEPHFEARLLRQRSAKQHIAEHAAIMALGCRTIALDVGTTTYLLAHHLRDQLQTKIFTNSVRIASELGTNQVEVYLAGGRMRRDEMSMGGNIAVEQFSELWFDIAFIGVSGVTTSGIYDYSFEDVEMKRVYLKRSSLRVLLCDSAKFQRMSLVHIAPLNAINVLVTDEAPPPAIADALLEAGVRVEIATANPEFKLQE